jgi:hypothetical protein
MTLTPERLALLRRMAPVGGRERARRLSKRRRRKIAKLAAKASAAVRRFKIPPERRSAIARHAALARWSRRRPVEGPQAGGKPAQKPPPAAA